MTTLSQLADFEFRSNEEIDDWPLIHVYFGTNPETGRPGRLFQARYHLH